MRGLLSFRFRRSRSERGILRAFAFAVLVIGITFGQAARRVPGASVMIADGSAISQSQATGVSVTSPLEVSLRTDRDTYKLGDEIKIEVLLTNKSRAPLYLYAGLDWGDSASISLWLKDMATGREVPQEFIHDAVTPPPTSKEAFVRLLSNHVYGIVLRSSLATLNIQKNGTYEVVGEYHSPIPASMNFGLPIWSREKGIVPSNRVTIKVTD